MKRDGWRKRDGGRDEDRRALLSHEVVAENTTNDDPVVIVRHSVPAVSELGWDELRAGVTHLAAVPLFVVWCHVACRDMAPGFRISVGIRLRLFWGVRRCLRGRLHCLGG